MNKFAESQKLDAAVDTCKHILSDAGFQAFQILAARISPDDPELTDWRQWGQGPAEWRIGMAERFITRTRAWFSKLDNDWDSEE